MNVYYCDNCDVIHPYAKILNDGTPVCPFCFSELELREVEDDE